MKVMPVAILLCCLLLLGTACAQENVSVSVQTLPAQTMPPSVAEAEIPANTAQSSVPPDEVYIPEQVPQSNAAADMDVDVDLTAMSSTMVYSEVYDMIMSPDDYMGQTIKVRGQYYNGYSEDTKQYYHFVIVADATACCQQGLEFIWNGEHDISEYPEQLTEIEIVGVFGLYDEQENTYCYLTVDNIQAL